MDEESHKSVDQRKDSRNGDIGRIRTIQKDVKINDSICDE